ncbi:FISUMP domain-containing protein [Chryseobacterium sp.]|uniref:FISUMP domain-containing protein n=1 Tax=Chryseobacterium sp. TaxID=1871047 RepID=UPI0035AEE598
MIKNLNIKKQLLTLFAITTVSIAYGQVGINNTSPKATLDVTAKNTDGSTPEGLIAPRLTGDQIQAANAQYGPNQAGTIVYATSAVTTPGPTTQNITAAGYYYFDGSTWLIIGTPPNITSNIYNNDGALTGNRQVDLASNTLGFTGGNVGVGIAIPDTSAILDVTSTTQGFAPPRVTKAQRDAILSPISGLIVYCTDCSGTIVAPTGCLSQNLGNPTTPNWTCVGSTTSASVVVSDCTGFSGSYTGGVPLSGANYKLTITNNSFSSATINFAAGDLVLSGITGLTVGTPTFSGGTVAGSNVTLVTGQTVVVTYPITGTPAADGFLTGTWTKLSLNCTNTQLVGKGSATFTLPQNLYVASVDLGGTGDVQGVVDNGTNKFTINVPYTAGKGTYDAYQGPWIQNESGTGQGGDANKFRISYPAGILSASGTLPVTIEVDGDGSFNALKLSPGTTMVLATLPFSINGDPAVGNIILNIVTCGAFTAPGVFKAFMCHNLGADTNADPFQPAAAIHGAKYQWGAQTNEAGRYISQATDQSNSGLIAGWNTSALPNGTWSDTSKTAQDPCPSGYRVPTSAQWNQVINSSNNIITRTGTWTISSTNYSSGMKLGNTLFLPAAGYRNFANGTLYGRGNYGHYWSSTQSTNAYAGNLYFASSGAGIDSNGSYRSYGFSVRCISE